MTKARDTANLTGSGVTLPLLDIDAGTDIGAALVDADLMIVDDGAGGTNRKATMTRLATYMGTKITGGSMVYLASSGAISDGTASVAFTQFDATKYDHYQFMFQHVVPVTDAVFLIAQTSTNGGTAYSSTDGDYHLLGTTNSTALRVAGHAGYTVGSGSGEHGCTGSFMLFAPHNTSSYTFSFCGGMTFNSADDDGYIYSMNASTTDVAVAGARIAAEDVDAIKFLFSSGNIESGEIVMYGIANGT